MKSMNQRHLPGYRGWSKIRRRDTTEAVIGAVTGTLTLCQKCDLRLLGPLPRQLARPLTLTGTDQVLTIEVDPAGQSAG
ncbi:hypothetical protein ACFWCB_10835 [Streptomyces sp. NPDC060048]|uniref:hypothetical protein n=1 Tax=unclassified Streptomyces TaxID=2593676 RepID=UPI0036AD6D6A